MEDKSFKYMEDAQSVTSSDSEVDGHPENLGYDEEFIYPTVDSTEDITYEVGFPPVYGLGFVLVVLTFLSLCYLIYHTIKDAEESGSEESLHSITPRWTRNTFETRTPLLRDTQETTPKRISPGISGFLPERRHLSSTPICSYRRSSPESIETFEPLESYRFVHPDIPNEMIGPRGSTSELEILRTSAPDSDYMRSISNMLPLHERTIHPSPFSSGISRWTTSSESDGLRLHERTIQIPIPFSHGVSRRTVSSSESDGLPLHERINQIPIPFDDGMSWRTVSSSESGGVPSHERTVQIPTSFTDGITRRTVSSSAHWTSSDPDDVELRPHSTHRDS